MAALNSHDRALWLRLVAWLKRDCPTIRPVMVKTVRMKDHGLTYYERRRFHIRINSKDDLVRRIDTLIHEWAHVLSWPIHLPDDEQQHHNAAWGAMYAAVYQSYLRWHENERKKAN